jgi:hypothetical protein
MSAAPETVDIAFAAAGASPRELEELTTALRRELLLLDVTSVERPPAGAPPEGARGIDVAAIGALIVELGKAAPVLGQIVNVVRGWAAREPDRSVKLTIDGDSLELTAVSEADQQQIIRDWMARHAVPAAGSPPAG